MSRSYRKPYCAVTGVYTDSHDDKKHAARCVRRSQDAWVRDVLAQRIDPDEVPVPDRLECKYNDVWSWGRDGHKRLQTPDAYAWSRYCLIQLHVELGVAWEYEKKLAQEPFISKWRAKLSRK